MGFLDIIVNPPALAFIIIGIIALLFLIGSGLDAITEWTGFGDGGGLFTMGGWLLVIIFAGIGIFTYLKNA